MKTITPLLLSIMFFYAFANSAMALKDEFVKLDITNNKLPIKKFGDSWLRISVPFKFLKHPKIEALEGRRPSSLSQAFNPKYLNKVKVKLWICFMNNYKKNLLRSSGNLSDAEFYQYYQAEVEYLTLEYDTSTKEAQFLFPAAIAERDGFMEAYVKPVGYVIEISQEGSSYELSDAVYFNFRGVTPQILESFRSQAVSKSSANRGILLPAHKVSMDLLDGMGPVKLTD